MLFCFTMFGREYFGELEERSLSLPPLSFWEMRRDGAGNVDVWLGRLHILSSPVTLQKRFDELYDAEGKRLELH
jgi:hypothetical protein